MSTIQYDEDGHPLASNHIGWNVEKLTENGWIPFMEPIESKSDARKMLRYAQDINPKAEYRLYEALEFPVKTK